MNKKVIILVAVLFVVFMGAAVAGTYFLLKRTLQPAVAMAENTVATEPAVPKAVTPIYKSLDPAFVVNIDDGRTVRFLQVKVDVMARNQAALTDIDIVEPRIRHDIIMLFSTMTREMIRDQAQREQLQAQVLSIINTVLQEQGKPGVEAVYFTSFVVQ
ncbi:MAG: flagellar basal body-associated FliL family protein [Moraxellaceae bacterium]|nr:flagellar basal body-associated FliL family protein [Moraxellaceae bacterium]MDP1776302.1 flagellar basal body-associated FliL family protein [Moraxellaceae bacterium]MDZ4296775.1 flagellar basal body-associated FliL family protein [Moraxellaceae bacterium]MDZ4387028.1 flagellar basal body-associated FliL family protein [Moraxellaceae bacterium]